MMGGVYHSGFEPITPEVPPDEFFLPGGGGWLGGHWQVL
jgi:hypothetical protein